MGVQIQTDLSEKLFSHVVYFKLYEYSKVHQRITVAG